MTGNYYTVCANADGRLTLQEVDWLARNSVNGCGMASLPVVARMARRNWWRVLFGREVDLTHLTVIGAKS